MDKNDFIIMPSQLQKDMYSIYQLQYNTTPTTFIKIYPIEEYPEIYKNITTIFDEPEYKDLPKSWVLALLGVK